MSQYDGNLSAVGDDVQNADYLSDRLLMRLAKTIGRNNLELGVYLGLDEATIQSKKAEYSSVTDGTFGILVCGVSAPGDENKMLREKLKKEKEEKRIIIACKKESDEKIAGLQKRLGKLEAKETGTCGCLSKLV
ncbi:hypothetical protein NP493_4987g00000 [Ridgeia piscesae]|uniref:Uncharacterized protein n=1 Tax=Ridgeia piscesae TaxID=27915 RepID=A0AAD9IWC5_RIDPI|nr:hypothetical protein NP493_4987g00000 [Ridgeia piscesae]